MAADYVSPFDERVRAAEPLAPRPASIRGRRVLQAQGAATARTAKEIFSKPAALVLMDDIARDADLVVEALAD